MGSFRLSARARAQLHDIYDYSAVTFGSYQANAYHAGLEAPSACSRTFPASANSPRNSTLQAERHFCLAPAEIEFDSDPACKQTSAFIAMQMRLARARLTSCPSAALFLRRRASAARSLTASAYSKPRENSASTSTRCAAAVAFAGAARSKSPKASSPSTRLTSAREMFRRGATVESAMSTSAGRCAPAGASAARRGFRAISSSTFPREPAASPGRPETRGDPSDRRRSRRAAALCRGRKARPHDPASDLRRLQAALSAQWGLAETDANSRRLARPPNDAARGRLESHRRRAQGRSTSSRSIPASSSASTASRLTSVRRRSPPISATSPPATSWPRSAR